MNQINFFIEQYMDEFYMLGDYPVSDIMREMTTDVNELVNHVLAHVMPNSPNIQGTTLQDYGSSLPAPMHNTMEYIVKARAANGGVYDMKGIVDVKKHVNLLCIEYIRALSENPHWFNHHLKFIAAAIGGIPDIISPSLCVCVEYGQAKITEGHDLAMSRSFGPQILTAIQMMVMRL